MPRFITTLSGSSGIEYRVSPASHARPANVGVIYWSHDCAFSRSRR